MNRLITARGPKDQEPGPSILAWIRRIGSCSHRGCECALRPGRLHRRRPRLLGDGKPVRARMFFGSPGSAPIAVAAGPRQVTCLEGRTDPGGLGRTALPARSRSVVESRERPAKGARRPRPKGPPAHETRRHECPAVRIECGPIEDQTSHVTTPVRALDQSAPPTWPMRPTIARTADGRSGPPHASRGARKWRGPFRTDAGRTLGPEHCALIDPICSPRTQERPSA